MKTLLLVGAVLATAVLLMRLIGGWLPRSHRASSRILLNQPRPLVWAIVRNQTDIANWWPEVRQVERLSDQVGQERWRQTLGNGVAMSLVIAEAEPPQRLRTVIDAEPGAPFGGGWLYELSVAGAGTELRVTEEGWIAHPILRGVARLMGHHRTLDSYLVALAHRLGETARPSHVRP